jgi:hypothetical protein
VSLASGDRGGIVRGATLTAAASLGSRGILVRSFATLLFFGASLFQGARKATHRHRFSHAQRACLLGRADDGTGKTGARRHTHPRHPPADSRTDPTNVRRFCLAMAWRQAKRSGSASWQSQHILSSPSHGEECHVAEARWFCVRRESARRRAGLSSHVGSAGTGTHRTSTVSPSYPSVAGIPSRKMILLFGLTATNISP